MCKIYPQNLSAKFIRKIYPQNLSAKFIRKIYPPNLSAKSIRKIYPQSVPAFSTRPFMNTEMTETFTINKTCYYWFLLVYYYPKY